MDSSFHEYLKAVIIDPSESPQQWITKIRNRTLTSIVFSTIFSVHETLSYLHIDSQQSNLSGH